MNNLKRKIVSFKINTFKETCVKVDLTGRIFGKLKVIRLERIGTHGKEYLCKCSCGNEKIIRGSTLTSGKQKGCGCLIGRMNKGKFNNKNSKLHIGEIWNKLTIIDIEQRINKRGYLMICKCDCGNETKQTYADLKNGKVVSCGCNQREKASLTGIKIGINNGSKECSKFGWHFIKDGVKIKMRSGYEVMYAIILENKNIEWKYEPKCFKLKNGMRYTPDFHLPQTNEWIEVKGQLTEKQKVKHQVFVDMGYKLKVIFIEDIQKELPYSYAKFKKDWVANHRGQTRL